MSALYKRRKILGECFARDREVFVFYSHTFVTSDFSYDCLVSVTVTVVGYFIFELSHS